MRRGSGQEGTLGRSQPSARRALSAIEVPRAGIDVEDDYAIEAISAHDLETLVEMRIHRNAGQEAELNLPSEITGLLSRPKAQLVAAPPLSPTRRRQTAFAGGPGSPTRRQGSNDMIFRAESAAHLSAWGVQSTAAAAKWQSAATSTLDDGQASAPQKGDRFAAAVLSSQQQQRSSSLGGTATAPSLDDSAIEARRRGSNSSLTDLPPRRDDRRPSLEPRGAAQPPPARGAEEEKRSSSGSAQALRRVSNVLGFVRGSGAKVGPEGAGTAGSARRGSASLRGASAGVGGEDGDGNGGEQTAEESAVGRHDRRRSTLGEALHAAQTAIAAVIGGSGRAAASDDVDEDGFDANGFLVQRRAPFFESAVIHPNSLFRRRWDALLFVAALVVTVEAPFAAAFLESTPAAILGLALPVDILFGVDVLVKCLTGFVSDDANTLEMDVHTIVRHYAQSAMLPDVLAALPWRLIGLAVHGGRLRSARYQNFVRIGRLSRCFKVFVVLVRLRRNSPTVKSLVTVVGLGARRA